MTKSLFSPLNPLRLRFSDGFFADLPARPGVYKMYNDDGSLLYIGKAKSLKDRLRSYRCPTEWNLPPKVQRLVHEVSKIEIEETHSEKDALLRESFLIRTLKPPYNSINKYPEAYSFLALQMSNEEIHWAIVRQNKLAEFDGWHKVGAFKGRGYLLEALAASLRRLWFLHYPVQACPIALMHSRLTSYGKLQARFDSVLLKRQFLRFWKGTARTFLLETESERHLSGFSKHMLNLDREELESFYRRGPWLLQRMKRKLGLASSLISSEQLEDCRIRIR